MTRARGTPLYGNCVITAPDGQPLCRTSESKVQWYVERNLGEVVSRHPTTLRLFFEPKGRDGADHPYTTAEKENICVVCGSKEDITRHHVVPRCFRKHFPIERKEHAIHDVLILCIKCHNEYEDHAFKLKQRISDETGIPIGGCGYRVNKEYYGVRTAAHALYGSYDKIPEPRRTELLNRLRDFFGKQEITKEDMIYAGKIDLVVADPDFKPFGQVVVEQLESIDEFILQWRRHFIEVMKPKHLPAFWSVDNALR